VDLKIACGFAPIPLKLKRHPRTLPEAKCNVHRHNGLGISRSASFALSAACAAAFR
jgi:hypothetical protein